MKKNYLVLFVLIFIVQLLTANVWQQSFTTEDVGTENTYIQTEQNNPELKESSILSPDSRVSMLWQTSDVSAVVGEVAVSSTTENSFVQWHLNNERVSLFHDTASPTWEHIVGDLDFGFPIDMLEDGSILAIGDGSTIKVFAPGSSTPTWEHSVPNSMTGLELAPDGLSVYVSYYYSENGVVEKFDIGNSTPVWTTNFIGGSQTLDMSGDGSTLIFTQYGGANSFMSVINTDDGSLIFQAPEYNQNNPAICYDASIIVNGDYSGYLHVYEFNTTLETYEEKWSYNVTGSGTSTWVGGMGISDDGSTIAVGTLDFVTAGFDGQIFLFNSDYPIPLWTYENFGDYVTNIDLSENGSLIAAAGYGPFDHSTADFMLFRKESNVPVFEINTPGSMFALDLASDGSFCTVGGKAVHAREMGSGGLLYSIDCDLGGGFITGTVNLDGEEDNSGVKIEIPELIDYYTYSEYDGSFTLNNVPAGTYSVEYSKVGYLANNSNNVVVLEGETTDLGIIEMITTGNPPNFLNATKGLNETVELCWYEHPQNTLEINIYRKEYEQSTYPEIPLSTVSAGEEFYIDTSALPLKEYFYVVTAELEGGFQSPYSNEDMGWTSSGFVVDEISVYEGATPTIDGVISTGEWDDAYMLDSSDFWGSNDNTTQPIGSVIGYFKMNTSMTELYVAYINYNDTDLEDHDEVALYIDDNNDGVFSPDTQGNEGNYWAAYYAVGNQLKFRPIYDTGGVGDVFYLPDPQLEASVSAGYLVYEFMIPIGTETWEINPSVNNQSSLAIFVLDDNTPDPHGFDGWWPLDNTNLFAPDEFGTINYGAVPQTPPAPLNVAIEYFDTDILELNWDMPPINDLDHFNIYYAFEDFEFELIDETAGIQYFYEFEYFPNSFYRFYVITVNQMGMESDPSEIVAYESVNADEDLTPIITKLNGNYPNPFNPTTTISFSLEQDKQVKLTIYNLKGQKVKQLVNDQLTAGQHELTWNGKDDTGKQTASGIYFYKMISGDYQRSKKMLLLK